MPTFSAIVLDRLVEPRSRSTTIHNPPLAPVNMAPLSERKGIPRPPHSSPALYATPPVTLLPDSPSSFPPSPYIVNHKRRGPRLQKCLSQPATLADAEQKSGENQTVDADNRFVAGKVEGEAGGLNFDGSQGKEMVNGSHEVNKAGGVAEGEEPLNLNPGEGERDGESDDFFDFLDSMSSVSNAEGDDSYGPERLWRPGTPIGDFYDAYEEISSQDGPRASYRNLEDELQEMRLNLLMEIEKRRQAEEAIENLQKQLQNLHHHLSIVGLVLPKFSTNLENASKQLDDDPAEDLSQQIIISRSVTASIARACARAEVEMEMAPQIEAKNFEIARLSDRLHYYEVANREMSQRNQEAVEMARQRRHQRKRRQNWFWGSVGLAVTLGAAAITWSYMPYMAPASHDFSVEDSGGS